MTRGHSNWPPRLPFEHKPAKHVCLCTAGRLDETIEAARRAVQQAPESFVARWALGVSLGNARRFEEAVSTLEAAVGMSGRQSIGFTRLAGVFGKRGKTVGGEWAASRCWTAPREVLSRLRTLYSRLRLPDNIRRR
jgi:hypothetical protein